MSIHPYRSSSLSFPSVDNADDDGLLAFGGDLSMERLVTAYESGIFPWYEEGQPILWWAPPKRMILEPENFKVSKSLRKSIEKNNFSISIDESFEEVITYCAKVPRKGQSGTWLTDEMLHSYVALHKHGFAHSFEVREEGKLIGGLYGVCIGQVFCGESMFSLKSDASKIAFYHLAKFCVRHEIDLIDCQLYTDHLASLGAIEIARDEFMDRLSKSVSFPDMKGPWKLE